VDLTIKSCSFSNLNSSDGGISAIYLNVPSLQNEEFLFDTIALSYSESTPNPIFYVNMYNLEGILGDFPTKYTEFKNKFKISCEILNNTNFIINDINEAKTHSLKSLICDERPCSNPKYIFIL
jgi:hypothetical protein